VLRYFRWVGGLEACSFLLLLGVAMPLKYLYARPEAVRVVGLLHGILFLLYCHAALVLALERKWSRTKAFLAFLAAFLPGGPLWFDWKLLERE
jgi:integral membrane protein